MMEYGQTKGLALCVCSQICLKAKRVDGRKKSFDGVKWRPWYGSVLSHMASGEIRSLVLSIYRVFSYVSYSLQSLTQNQNVHEITKYMQSSIMILSDEFPLLLFYIDFKVTYLKEFIKLVKPSFSQHCVDSRHTVSRCHHLHKQVWFHHPWGGLQNIEANNLNVTHPTCGYT